MLVLKFVGKHKTKSIQNYRNYYIKKKIKKKTGHKENNVYCSDIDFCRVEINKCYQDICQYKKDQQRKHYVESIDKICK